MSQAPRTTQGQRSLFGEILDWMLAPLLLIWPMSVALTWLVAQSIANPPYDRELGEMTRALAHDVAAEYSGGRAPQGAAMVRRLERTAAQLVRLEDDDHIYFQLLGLRGELLAGEASLHVPPSDEPRDNVVRYRDDVLKDEPVRVAYVWLPVGAPGAEHSVLVQVAERLDKRSQLATEIIKGVILPQFVILPVAVMLVWFALSRAIKPLSQLQQRIRSRSSGDLSPIPEGDVPEEVAPLVAAINDVLLRLDKSMAGQRHFLADAAHQLRTPLAGLRMQAELAERELDGMPGDHESVRHSLQQIAISSQRAAHMVNQLLAMARAEDEGQALQRERVDLAQICIDVVRDFVPRALAKRIDLGYEGPSGTAATPLLAHPVLVRELVRNLVDNAILYTPEGGTVTARVAVADAGSALVLEVEDSGPGIAAGEREAVFRPFYRVLGVPGGPVEGSGLGLAIVKEIADKHAATVHVQDTNTLSPPLGPGARITVRFVASGLP